MDSAGIHVWPDSLDTTALFIFAVAALGLPLLGYGFAVVDFRRYLRSLRRAISTIVYRDSGTPAWDKAAVPRCIAVFDLEWPCDEESLTRAYRRKVKRLHPDRGGDERRFLMLQRYFEEAMALVNKQKAAEKIA